MSLPLLQAHDDANPATRSSPPSASPPRVVFGRRHPNHQSSRFGLHPPHPNRAGHKFSSVVFSIFVCPVLVVAHAVVAFACWSLVALLPMAHLNASLAMAVATQPLSLKVEPALDDPHSVESKAAFSIVRNSQVANAGGLRFLFAKTFGIPNLVLNSLAVVVAVAAVPYVIPASMLLTPAGAVLYLTAACFTVPPLGYFLCVAITSIAAKTSFAFGAILNASFGSIIEII